MSKERSIKAETERLARIARISMIRALKEQGNNNAAIGKLLGISESSVRRCLEEDR